MNREKERFLIGLDQALFVPSLLDIGDLNSLFAAALGVKSNCAAVSMQFYVADSSGDNLANAQCHVG